MITRLEIEGGAEIMGDPTSIVSFRTDTEDNAQADMNEAIAQFAADGFRLHQIVTYSTDTVQSERWVFERETKGAA